MAAVPPARPASTMATLRLEQLWVLAALCLVGVFISLTPTLPNDFWWHLKAGELVATEGIPTTNRFAWTLPADTPFVYQSWLGEWLFYAIYRIGGFPLIIFIRNLLGLVAFGLVAVEAQRRSGSWRLAAGAVLLAGAMTMNNLTARTQNWSWIPFALLLTLLGRYVDGQLRPRTLLVSLPLLMLFWVNAHGAFTMGLLVTGAFVVGETLRRVMRQPRALEWGKLRMLALAGGLAIVATLINPLGPGVYGYVLQLLSDAPSQQLINEWRSPTPRDAAGIAFYLGILVVIASFAFARRRPTISEVIVICGLAWQAFVGVRYVVWFGMAALPMVAQVWGTPRQLFAAAPVSSGRERGGGQLGNWLVALLLLLIVVAVQPWFKPLLALPQPYQALFVTMPAAPQLFTTDTPVAATTYLRAHPCPGQLFNEMGYGSYLAWALYPTAQTFVDPRVELYPLTLWQDYVKLTQGREVAALLAHYNIACVLLDTVHQPGLAAEMGRLPGWERSFAAGRSEVWRRP